MELFAVVGFILLGIILLIVEIIFVPGTTIVGIGGFVVGGYGVYLSYQYYGNTVGTITLIVTAIICFGGFVYALKTRSWEKLALKNTMDSRFNDEYKLDLKVGDEGESVSSLKPIGKAIFKDNEIEVSSLGEYVREHQPIRIIRVQNKKIYVEPIKKS